LAFRDTSGVDLRLAINRLPSFTMPVALTNLASLDLFENALTNVSLPAGLSALTNLNLGVNPLTSFTMPPGATNLTGLFFLFNSQLTNISLPRDLARLSTLLLSGAKLKSLDLPPGLISLASLNLSNNQLTNLTLPPDMNQLSGIFLDGNPLTTFVLSEHLAATNLAATVSALQAQGVNVFSYPLAVQLLRPHQLTGAFQFGITGPPGVYTVVVSSDLATWSDLGTTTNTLGSISFTDTTTQPAHKFYRARLQ
jgi:hypothetical protein